MKDPALASSSRLGGAVISDRVVASLLEELTNGRYAQADRLPAEVDLATELGVSRTVIRDALSEMERAGYVERVRGIGTVKTKTSSTDLEADPATLFYIVEFLAEEVNVKASLCTVPFELL